MKISVKVKVIFMIQFSKMLLWRILSVLKFTVTRNKTLELLFSGSNIINRTHPPRKTCNGATIVANINSSKSLVQLPRNQFLHHLNSEPTLLLHCNIDLLATQSTSVSQSPIRTSFWFCISSETILFATRDFLTLFVTCQPYNEEVCVKSQPKL